MFSIKTRYKRGFAGLAGHRACGVIKEQIRLLDKKGEVWHKLFPLINGPPPGTGQRAVATSEWSCLKDLGKLMDLGVMFSWREGSFRVPFVSCSTKAYVAWGMELHSQENFLRVCWLYGTPFSKLPLHVGPGSER